MNSAKPHILIIGGGGHARSVIDAIEAADSYSIAGIVDQDTNVSYRGYSVLGGDDDLPTLFRHGIKNAAMGIGTLGGHSKVRVRILSILRSCGFSLPLVVDPSAVISADAAVGEASFIGKLAVINAATTIGRCAIINSGAMVEHDCFVGDFAHVSVNATLCGGVSVGRFAMVGAGATVIQGVHIGEGAIVGAGAVVLRSVPDGETVVGVFNGH